MPELSLLQWAILGGCALLVGLTKTGIPGLGILVAPLLASVFPARASTGLLLPLLLAADVVAVAYYRRHAVWSHLWRLIPFSLTGIVIGYVMLGRINDQQLSLVIGAMIIVLLVVNLVVNPSGKGVKTVPQRVWLAAVLGICAGITTMLSNAAGPLMILYLLSMGLPKEEFMGTGAWYFLLLNLVKVPFSASLGLITWESLALDGAVYPVALLGTLAGIFILKRTPEKVFRIVAQVLAAAAALNLLVSFL